MSKTEARSTLTDGSVSAKALRQTINLYEIGGSSTKNSGSIL